MVKLSTCPKLTVFTLPNKVWDKQLLSLNRPNFCDFLQSYVHCHSTAPFGVESLPWGRQQQPSILPMSLPWSKKRVTEDHCLLAPQNWGQSRFTVTPSREAFGLDFTIHRQAIHNQNPWTKRPLGTSSALSIAHFTSLGCTINLIPINTMPANCDHLAKRNDQRFSDSNPIRH